MIIGELGKRPRRADPRTLSLAKYLPAALSPPPLVQNYVRLVADWGMMLNDVLGDCVEAAAGHMVQQWTAYASKELIPPDPAILKSYEDAGGYVPGDPSTDNGTDMLSFLNYWRKQGVGGHQILAYVAVDPWQPEQVRQAIRLFGNCYLGLQLPASVQGANFWSVSPGVPRGNAAPGSWGGHCVPLVGYDAHTFTAVTWGAPLRMAAGFLKCYADEAYAVLSADWIEETGLSPSLFNLAALRADLAAL